MALVGLFVLAVFYTLHLAQDFFLPIVLAILLDFLLSPVVRALRKYGIAEPLGAGIVMLGLLAVTVVGVYRLSGPAAEYIALAPEQHRDGAAQAPVHAGVGGAGDRGRGTGRAGDGGRAQASGKSRSRGRA